MNDKKLITLDRTHVNSLRYMEECAKIALPYVIERGRGNENLTAGEVASDAWNIAKAMYNQRLDVIEYLAVEHNNESDD